MPAVRQWLYRLLDMKWGAYLSKKSTRVINNSIIHNSSFFTQLCNYWSVCGGVPTILDI